MPPSQGGNAGASPTRSTKIRPHLLCSRKHAFQAWKTGARPVGATKITSTSEALVDEHLPFKQTKRARYPTEVPKSRISLI